MGGEPSRRRARAISRPAAQLPPCSTLANGNDAASLPSRPAARAGGAAGQPHGKRAPSDDGLGATLGRGGGWGGVAKLEHAGVDEQAAVAVFGEAREAIERGPLDASRLQWLHERVGQP